MATSRAKAPPARLLVPRCSAAAAAATCATVRARRRVGICSGDFPARQRAPRAQPLLRPLLSHRRPLRRLVQERLGRGGADRQRRRDRRRLEARPAERRDLLAAPLSSLSRLLRRHHDRVPLLHLLHLPLLRREHRRRQRLRAARASHRRASRRASEQRDRPEVPARARGGQRAPQADRGAGDSGSAIRQADHPHLREPRRPVGGGRARGGLRREVRVARLRLRYLLVQAADRRHRARARHLRLLPSRLPVPKVHVLVLHAGGARHPRRPQRP